MTLLFTRTGLLVQIPSICTSRVYKRIKYLSVCLFVWLAGTRLTISLFVGMFANSLGIVLHLENGIPKSYLQHVYQVVGGCKIFRGYSCVTRCLFVVLRLRVNPFVCCYNVRSLWCVCRFFWRKRHERQYWQSWL